MVHAAPSRTTEPALALPLGLIATSRRGQLSPVRPDDGFRACPARQFSAITGA